MSKRSPDEQPLHVEAAAAAPVCGALAACYLVVQDMMVHRVDDAESIQKEEDENIVSTQKPFRLVVALLDARRRRVRGAHQLNATLLYENGRVVEEGPLEQRPMTGGEADVDENGEAHFTLQIAALSSQRQQQRFRVRVSVEGRPDITNVITKPLRTLTKIRPRKLAHTAALLPGEAAELGGCAFPTAFSIASIEGVLAEEEASPRQQQLRLMREWLHARAEQIRDLQQQNEEIKRALRTIRSG